MVPDRRAAVMQAALASFADRGFHGTRMPDIAERAGVAIGTIYRYFPTKEGLVNAVYRECKQANTEAMTALFVAGLPAGEQVLTAWHALVATAVRDHLAFRFLELHHHADYLDAASHAVADQAHAGPVAFISAGQVSGLIRTDLDPAAILSLVWGALVGFVRAHPAPDFAMVDASGRAIWRMIAA